METAITVIFYAAFAIFLLTITMHLADIVKLLKEIRDELKRKR